MSEKKKKTAPPVEEAPVPQTPEEAPAAQEDPREAAFREAMAQQEEKYLRLCADFDNFRRRTAREKETLRADVTAQTAKSFLPVFDNLERALKQPTADEAYRKGVEMTLTQFRQVLSGLGVREIPALGEKFDPNVHDAIGHVDDPDLPENTVKEVLQTGFLLGDTVVRHAMVIVAN